MKLSYDELGLGGCDVNVSLLMDKERHESLLRQQLREADPPLGFGDSQKPLPGLAEWKKQKLCCIGLCKTGTKSFGSSLSYKLSYSCQSNFWPIVSDYTSEIHDAEIKNEVDEILHTKDGFSDYPWMFLYEYVYNNYPRIKFILTLRESPNKYAESEINWHLKHGTQPDTKEDLIKRYNEHNERVREFFKDKPGRMLEMCFECGDSWGKLGRFIDLPFEVYQLIQNDPLFHTNKSEGLSQIGDED